MESDSFYFQSPYCFIFPNWAFSRLFIPRRNLVRNHVSSLGGNNCLLLLLLNTFLYIVHSVACGEKYATLPATVQCGPMKLMSLEEAQARSLSPNHPVMRERQRENSLPDTSTAAMYHTVIDLSDSRYHHIIKQQNTTYTHTAVKHTLTSPHHT